MKSLRKKSELFIFVLALCIGLFIIVPYQVEAIGYTCTSGASCGNGWACSCYCWSNTPGWCTCYGFDNGCAVYTGSSYGGSCMCDGPWNT